MNESCSHYYLYTYDPVGNRTKLETKKSTTSYSYDAADELVSSSKLRHRRTEVTNYAYDLNGNEASEGSTHYSYNLENKLTQVVDKHEKVSYSYTGEGLMLARSTHSETTTYAWDTSSELPELALETNARGSGRFQLKDTRAYTYGAGAIGTETQRGSYTFHTDALGSVVALSDSHGKLVESYRYTPYGDSYGPGQSGDAEVESLNSMRFAGQYLDSESDLYNMRAREYEPETGRFLEVDPLECDSGGSCGSTYLYVDDRPTVMTDPNGEKAMMGANTSGVSQVSCGAAGSCRSCFTTSIGGPTGTQGPQGDTKKELYGNGCGPNGWMNAKIPDRVKGVYDFRQACSYHDACYGRSWGRWKPACDVGFLKRMLKNCGNLSGWDMIPGVAYRHALCIEAANIYFAAVSVAGCWSFYNGQMKKCSYTKKKKKTKTTKDLIKCDNSINTRSCPYCSVLLVRGYSELKDG
jgi:RHS repeat-associated protein